VRLCGLVPQKIYWLKGPLPVFADKVVESDPAVRQDLLYSKRTLFTITAGHDLGAKCYLHFGPGPNVLI